MTYLLQVQTSDFRLQLRTEVEASSIAELQQKAARMVKRNQAVIGMTYLVAKYTKKAAGGFTSETLKKGTIAG